MLRSKFHRPWQPHVSDGQLLNPSAPSRASETTFSEVIEEAEEQVHTPESLAVDAAQPPAIALEDIEPLPPVAEAAPGAKSNWYSRLRAKLAGQ